MPETAYIILGHGGEDQSTTVVPPDCALVVDAHSGELVWTEDIHKSMSKLHSSSSAGKKKLLNPADNYKFITNTLSTEGSMAIYKEGETCPNFVFELIAYSFPPNSDNEIELSSSGIIDYPFNSKHIFATSFPKTTPVTSILNYFDGSIYPTRDQVIQADNVLANIFGNKYDHSLDHFINYAIIKQTQTKDILTPDKLKEYEKIVKLVNLRLSDLFNMVRSGQLKPGVFYNLVCRATSAAIRDKAEIIKINNSFRAYNPKSKQGFIPEILKQIAEAERHRKPYISQKIPAINELKKQINLWKPIIAKHNKEFEEAQKTGDSEKLKPLKAYKGMINERRAEINILEKQYNALIKNSERRNKNKSNNWKRAMTGKWTLTQRNKNNRSVSCKSELVEAVLKNKTRRTWK